MDFEKFLVIPQVSYDPTENELWASTVLSFFGAYLSTIDIDHRPWFMATSVATNLIALPLSNWMRSVYDIPWYLLYYNLSGIGINIAYNIISNKALLKLSGLATLFTGSVINTFLIGGMQYARRMVEEGEKIVMRDAQQFADETLAKGQRIISGYSIEQSGNLITGNAVFTVKQDANKSLSPEQQQDIVDQFNQNNNILPKISKTGEGGTRRV